MKSLDWMMRNRNVFAKTSAVPGPRRRVVVVENLAEHLEQVLDAAEFQETIVVAESPADPTPNLAVRVAGRIAELERRGMQTASATLLFGRRQGDGVAAARELVARSLLLHLKVTGGNELVMVAPNDGERDEILALLERLLAELDTGSITIRLKFGSSGSQQPATARALGTPTSLQAAS